MKVEATIVMARCSKNKAPYGMRLQKAQGIWVGTWAFPLQESAAKKEGYDSKSVSGDIDLLDEYPGCPHCGAGGFVQCGKCKKIGCFSSQMKSVTCPHCGNVMENFSDGGFSDIKGDAI
jgi:ribosomal protein S27E